MSNNNTAVIVGKLYHDFGTIQVSDKFTKREFVIETGGQYPQYIQLQLAQDKCSLLDGVNLGSDITAHCNIRGRVWDSPNGAKYFNTLDVWKIEAQKTAVPAQAPSNQQAPQPQQGQLDIADDLPF